MDRNEIHQEIYISITILAFVTAAITQIVDPTVFHTLFVASVVKAYSFMIALLILFYVSFSRNWETLELHVIKNYQRRLRNMHVMTAALIIVALEPDLFGANLVSTMYSSTVIFIAVPFNVVMTILLACSPLLQNSRMKRFDVMGWKRKNAETPAA